MHSNFNAALPHNLETNMARAQQALKATARVELNGYHVGDCGGALKIGLTSATVQIDIDFPVSLDDVAGMIAASKRVEDTRNRLDRMGKVVFWRVRTGSMVPANRAPDEALEEGEPGVDVTDMGGKLAGDLLNSAA